MALVSFDQGHIKNYNLMAKLKFIRNGKLPFRKIKISINNDSFFLKGDEYKEIDLPKGDYNFIIKMDWWKSINQITIDSDDSSVIIKHYLPDMFYIIGVVGSAILTALTFLSLVGVVYISTWVLLFIIFQIYFYFTKQNKYFTFEITSVNRDI